MVEGLARQCIFIRPVASLGPIHFLICTDPPLRFTLGGRTYLDGDTVLITEIGEGDNAALLCVTDSTNCCASQFVGEFYYPDGSIVNVRGSQDNLYRNRGDGFIRLNRRNSALSPLGRYRCAIPDSSGVIQSIYIIIGELDVEVKSYNLTYYLCFSWLQL